MGWIELQMITRRKSASFWFSTGLSPPPLFPHTLSRLLETAPRLGNSTLRKLQTGF